jgi:hypothetical protein
VKAIALWYAIAHNLRRAVSEPARGASSPEGRERAGQALQSRLYRRPAYDVCGRGQRARSRRMRPDQPLPEVSSAAKAGGIRQVSAEDEKTNFSTGSETYTDICCYTPSSTTQPLLLSKMLHSF